jgi:hypothetical protein
MIFIPCSTFLHQKPSERRHETSTLLCADRQALGVLEEMRAKGHSPALEKLDLVSFKRGGAR